MAADNELLRRYADTRSEEAFAAVVRNYLSLVYHAALRQLNGDSHRAEDVTQAVFTDLARKADSLCRHPALASWLHTAVRYTAAKLRRAEAVRSLREQEAETMNTLLGASSQSANWVQVRPYIDEVLAKLRERDRAAILLRCFDGRSFAEVGAALGISEDAARMRVDRALAKMRRLFAQRGITSTTAAFAALLAESHAALPAGLASAVAGRAVTAFNALSPVQLVLGRIIGVSKFSLATGISIALSGGMIGSAWWQVHRLHLAMEAPKLETDRSLAEQKQSDQRLKSALAEAAKLRIQLAGLRKRPAASAAGGDPSTDMDPIAQGKEFMLRHPEVRQALENYGHARMRWEFGPALARLHLSPDQMEQVLSILERGHSMGVGNGNGGQFSLATGEGPFANAGDKQRAVAAIVGPEASAQLNDYHQLTAARTMSGMLAGALWDTPTPLTPGQSEQLAQIIGSGANNNRVDWDTVMAKAPGVLSPAQLQVLAGIKAEQEFETAISAAWSK